MLMPRNILRLPQLVLGVTHRNGTLRHLQTSKYPLLAGHSKWANIKHIKALKDGQKAALFTKFSRQIRLAVQDGGSPDPNLNSQLRSVIDEALRKNMPQTTIQNSIKKSQQSKAQLKKWRLDIRYKQKVYLICIIYTDNFSGLKMEITPLVKKAGGLMVDVSHMFEDFGLVEATLNSLPPGSDLEERATEDAIECGAEEVEVTDVAAGTMNFICNPLHLNALRRSLESKGYTIDSSEHLYSPNSFVQLSAEERKPFDIFLRKLRDIPGLEDIYDNVQLDNSQ